MTHRLIWKLLLTSVPVIGVTVLIIWLAIDKLAATYFMRLMQHYAIEPHTSHRMFIEAVHRYLLWAALAALVLALLLSYLMTRRVLRPLSQMTRISQELAAGNFTNRVEIVSHDEVGQLGIAFNRMADSLERLEGLRKSMVSDIAHELRTPLTNLRGYFEGLEDAVISPSRETLTMLEAEIMRLVNLVEDLQQLTKADAAQAFLRRRDLKLASLIDELLPLFDLRLRERRIQVVVTIDPPDLIVHADRDKLLQVLHNLLENALNYSPEGGEVEVNASRCAKLVNITVTNAGEDISPEDLPFIFERFFRAERSRSREQGGAGIGLAIVKQIVIAHGGVVDAESSRGVTRIKIHLPA